MKKALMMASVASMIDLFNMDNIEILKNLGYEVEVACNFEYGSITSQERVDEFKEELIRDNFKVYHLPVPRSIYAIGDIVKSYKMMKKLCDVNNYEIVHCHSPIGGVIARLACRKARKKGTKVIYTAHGFHFYKGAPLTNWLIYYPLEKWLAKYTDTLITINIEDYDRAKRKLKAKRVEYIPGIGIDLDKLDTVEVDRYLKRSQLGLPKEAFVVLSVGELNKNKNHEVVIRAIAKKDNYNIHYVICGQGPLYSYLNNLSKKLEIEGQVHLLGFRHDVLEICKISNLFALPSYREGLPVALMEAMASGLPVVCSKIRGNVDLVDEHGGFQFDPQSEDECRRAIQRAIDCQDKELGLYNRQKIRLYEIHSVTKIMRKLYEEIIH